eukprot:TRINITY_DN27004_c0_g1_i1.p1 TRINITY_DN27004_c0_g1~~TRINITY_DN27004_c0_g1_i1.p1  ORF type:complete len:398 (-),score=30.55 TRINITY_DN27004_c0_g1_i1:344-1537(-)
MKNGMIFVPMCLYFLTADAIRNKRKKVPVTASLMNISSNASSQHTCFKGPAPANKYDKQENVGAGAFGKVFKAKDTKTGETVAIKEVKCKLFQQVEQDVMSLKLPFVADIKEIIKSGGPFFRKVSIVTPFYEGGDVSQYVKVGNISYELLKSWGKQMAYGLWVLHRNGILYRDLKPENTFVIDDKSRENIVLSDFGLAMPSCEPVACSTTTCGTPSYISPAVAKGRPYGYEADWWAHAVALFVMETAEYPFLFQKDQRKLSQMADAFRELESKTRKHKELRRYLLHMLDDKTTYEAFENDGVRKLMIGKASEHPILKDSFWHGIECGAYASQMCLASIDAYWFRLCDTMAINKEKCVPVHGGQQGEGPPSPRRSTRRSASRRGSEKGKRASSRAGKV